MGKESKLPSAFPAGSCTMGGVVSIMTALAGVAQVLWPAVFGLMVEVGYCEHHLAVGYGMPLAVDGVTVRVDSWHPFADVAASLAHLLDEGLPFGRVGAAAWVAVPILDKDRHRRFRR